MIAKQAEISYIPETNDLIMTSDLRRLAAIMFTDMVGYSALAQVDEERALDLLYLHQAMVRSIYPQHQGKEVKTIGDAFMLEFSSAVNAVKCAVQIQREFSEYNRDKNENDRIYLRIGVHVGEVVDRDDDIYGDGVNISSRLEPIAQPGGICISEDVERHIRNKVDVAIMKMEPQDLKNINLPIDIYQILLYAEPTAAPPKQDNNKLAVLPFQDLSPDKDTDYFADGLTEEITMHLSRLKNLKVVSRTTSMRYKNSDLDLQEIGKKLNARYILEGSVRRYEDQLRITAQLIDVATDTHLWAETYKGNIAEIFDIQENVSKNIVEELKVALSPEEQVALSKRSTENIEAYDVYLRARGMLFHLTKSYLLSAIDLFRAAIELDARFASAYAGLSEAYSFLYEAHDKKGEFLDKAMEASLKAIMYDATSSEAYSALGYVYYNKSSKEEALTSILKAIELDGDNFFAHWILGRLYRLMDRDKDAVQEFDTVLELNENFHTAIMDLKMVNEKLGNEQELERLTQKAIPYYRNYLLRFPDDTRAHIFYGFFLLRAGNVEEAKTKMRRAIELSPNDVGMMYNAACFYSQIKELESAIKYLKLAIENGFGNFEYLQHDPDLANLKGTEEFQEILRSGGVGG